jgi:hypothetical protein
MEAKTAFYYFGQATVAALILWCIWDLKW